MIFLAVDSSGTQPRWLLGALCAVGGRSVRQQRFLGDEYPRLYALLTVLLVAGERRATVCIAGAGFARGQPSVAAQGAE